MKIRAIIRDILSIYLGYELVKGYLLDDFTITISIIIAAFVLLVFGVWFILERFGIIPKIT